MSGKPVWTIDEVVENLRPYDYFADGALIGYAFDKGGYDLVAFTAAQKAAVKIIFSLVAELVDLDFAPAKDGKTSPNIHFVNAVDVGEGVWGFGGYGGVTVGVESSTGGYAFGTYDFTALTHEIGHALGLPHPGDYNAGNGAVISYENSALYYQDSRQYTLMSYFEASNTGAEHKGRYASTFLLDDVVALQATYGANTETRANATVYGFNSTANQKVYDFTFNVEPVIAIWDGGGIDTIDLSGSAVDQRLNLNAGAFSDVCGLTDNLAVCYNVVIENGTGGRGNDEIVGNDIGNRLDGGAGADTLKGGWGDDVYLIDSADDRIVENARRGADKVVVGFSYTLADNLEHLSLTGGKAIDGTGNAADNAITGNRGVNKLTGGAGDDTLDGGGGGDALDGGAGDDSYVIRTASDEIIDAGGTDGVVSSSSYALRDGLENLTLSGSGKLVGTGNAAANVIIGNAGANTLTGAGGADTLEGGAGADLLDGGANDDRYITDGLDTIRDTGGHDTVVSSASFVLAANMEALTLAGSAIAGTGNASANRITGNDLANQLDGGGGADTLSGGKGDDLYRIDNAGDRIQEQRGGGIDTVSSAIAFTLAGSFVEGLILTGRAAVAGTGNGFDNAITGNVAGNRLSGGAGDDTLDGGAGADSLIGGSGNDVYVADAAGDRVVEAKGGGRDAVRASIDYSLSASIEDLVLTGKARSGTGNELANRITGNALANRLRGGSGNDTLDGAAGGDTMEGGTGNDRYQVDNSRDRIVEGAGGGKDVVEAAVSFSIAGQAVEELRLIGGQAIDAVGSASANRITGNAAANAIEGGAGDDTIDGGAGADLMHGGTGSDSFVVDHARDRVVERGGEGNDSVRSAVDFSLAGQSIEALVLTGSAAIRGTGSSIANRITGNAAANRLDGGGGADTLVGGKGDDIYVLDNIKDVAAERAGAGHDLVLSAVTHKLGANLEDLTLTGSRASAGTGNALANRIIGNSAANRIDGGTGDDTLEGGAGDDIYVVTSIGDIIVEAAGRGRDLVISAFSYTIASTALEHITLTGDAYSASGNDAANRLTGNAIANYLVAGLGSDTLDGGAAADWMYGGTGNDLYIVDDALDYAGESFGEGRDTVSASVSYTLGWALDHLELTGSRAIDGTGNDLDNRLTGNRAANVLNGGTGADTLTGGRGNDSYVIDSAGDRIVEKAKEGSDTVVSSISYTLATHLEHLVLDGYADLSGTGNDGGNRITGSWGLNTLSGGLGDDTLDGGYGGDRLTGGKGDDVYLVDSYQDSVIERAGEGRDVVLASATYQLDLNIETLRMTGSGGYSGSGNRQSNTLIGSDGADSLDGAGGSDTVNGGDGDDVLIVTQESDIGANERVNGGAGIDTLQIAAAMSIAKLVIGKDVEQLASYSSVSLTAAQLGQFTGVSAGEITITEAGKADLSKAAVSTTMFHLATGGIALSLGGATGYCQIYGSAGADTVIGGAFGDQLDGDAGNDSLAGGDGADYILGGAGRDSIAGGGGDDTLVIASQSQVTAGDRVSGGADLDTLRLDDAIDITGMSIAGDVEQLSSSYAVRLGAAQLAAFTSVAAAEITIASAGSVDLSDATISTTTFRLAVGGVSLRFGGSSAYLWLYGSDGTDTIAAGNGGGVLHGFADHDSLSGGDGNDWIDGGSGRDSISGGAGDDTIVIAAGADLIAGERITGGADVDTLSIEGEGVDLAGATIGEVEQVVSSLAVGFGATQLGSFDYVQAAGIQVTTAGTADLDGVILQTGSITLMVAGITLSLEGAQPNYFTVNGSSGADDVTGGGWGDTLFGAAGADRLSGGEGGDWIEGGAGADTLAGGADGDVLFGGSGGDLLAGGAGADQYRCDIASDSSGAAYDILQDCDFTEDHLDLGSYVSMIASPMEGALSAATFDADLGAALGGGLLAGSAVLFHADAGGLADALFLIVDGSGTDGYQSGSDYVFLIQGADPTDLSLTFFI